MFQSSDIGRLLAAFLRVNHDLERHASTNKNGSTQAYNTCYCLAGHPPGFTCVAMTNEQAGHRCLRA